MDNCEQQGASGRISARMSAIEITQAKVDQQLCEVLHTSQQTTQVLNNLTSMFTIMMAKMGNSGSILEPTTPTAQNTNSNMPSVDPMLNSGACSEEDTPRKKARTMVRTEGEVDLANLSPEGVMVGGGSVEGDSKVIDSKEDVVEVNGSPAGTQVDGVSLEGGNMIAAGPSQVALTLGVPKVSGKNAASGSKVAGSEGDGNEKIVSEEGGSGGSGNGDIRKKASGDVDVVKPQSPGKRVTPKKPRKKKRHITSPKVGASGSQDVTAIDQVSSDHNGVGLHFPTKLLIFNVHGTLADCSLLSEPNPNTSIRSTTRSSTRRIVFRPCLMEFLDKCFKDFKVAFWGIKSQANMEDIVAEIMRKFKGLGTHKPLFCWSAKDLEEDNENIGVAKWKKPLSKVWGIWPEFNEGNTVIIDHMSSMVDCNPNANVIIPPAFYVENMAKLADDNHYLRKQLWPILEHLGASDDVHQFRSLLLDIQQAGGDESENLQAAGRTTRSSKIKVSSNKLSGNCKESGEGICELQFTLIHVPSPSHT